MNEELITVVCYRTTSGDHHPDETISLTELKEIGGWLACDVCGNRMRKEGHIIIWIADTWQKITSPIIWRLKGWRSDLLYWLTQREFRIK